MRLPLVMLLALVLPRFAAAQIPTLCAHSATQAAATECASGKYKAADAELNRVWGKLMVRLDASGRRYATDAQRAWLLFRDKECVSRTGGGPDQQGSIWPMLYLECETLLTQERTRQLAEQVKCPGGDLACPAE